MRFLIVLFVGCAYAAKPLGHEVCVASCYYSLLKAKYAGASSKAQTACTNKLRVQSTYYCMKLHCQEEDIEPGVAWWAGSCTNSTKVVNIMAYRTSTANATESYLANLPTVKQKQKDVLDGAAVPSADNWEVVYRSVYTYSEMRDYLNAVRYGQITFSALVIHTYLLLLAGYRTDSGQLCFLLGWGAEHGSYSRRGLETKGRQVAWTVENKTYLEEPGGY